jgi:DNA polymerase elongation subunit (family B)
MRIFRKQLKAPIFVPFDEDTKSFTRRAYTGGRTECYRPGIYDDVTVYDVNSMYPYVMANYPVPSSARTIKTKYFSAKGLGFYEVDYIQTNKTLPPLLRDEHTHDFQYTGYGVYTTNELNLLREIGGTFKVTRGIIFRDTAYLFKDIVTRYYNLRLKAKKEGNKALDWTAKILLNSLYGKFGQRPIKHVSYLATKERIRELLEAKANFTIHGAYLTVVEPARVEHEFCAIAAYITSYARIELYRHIMKAPANYIYSDTDSIHVFDTQPYIQDEINLGGLKIEKSGRGAYAGKKLYAIQENGQDIVKAKGFGRSSNMLTFDTIASLLDGTEYQIPMQAFPTSLEVLENKREFGVIFERKRTLRKTSK